MSSSLAYFNGQFVPATQLSISVHDAGFVWGATVTDRARTFNGRLFRLDEHLRRFRASCELARVPLRHSNQQLAAISERLIGENRVDGEWSILWLATPGVEVGSPTLIAYTQPIDQSRAARLWNDGVSLVCVPAEMGISPRIKHRNRLAWWIASDKAHQRDPDAQPLIFNPHCDYVLETPTSNVIAVFDDWLVSPPQGAVLEGISLGVVKELCDKLDLGFVRRDIERDELTDASELFLSNTTDCVVGVSRLDGEPVPFPGPVLNRLLDAWSELVGMNLRQPDARS